MEAGFERAQAFVGNMDAAYYIVGKLQFDLLI
jgi:hypothetical protein